MKQFRRWLANRIYDHTVLVEDTTMLLFLCEHANKDAFKNGVTDPSDHIDEGDVRAGNIIWNATKALREFTS